MSLTASQAATLSHSDRTVTARAGIAAVSESNSPADSDRGSESGRRLPRHRTRRLSPNHRVQVGPGAGPTVTHCQGSLMLAAAATVTFKVAGSVTG